MVVYLELFIKVLAYLLVLVGVLAGVAFMILFERRVLGYIQLRKGPNRVGWGGVLQSFRDAIKLFIKESGFPSFSNSGYFYYSPPLSLFLVLLV